MLESWYDQSDSWIANYIMEMDSQSRQLQAYMSLPIAYNKSLCMKYYLREIGSDQGIATDH